MHLLHQLPPKRHPAHRLVMHVLIEFWRSECWTIFLSSLFLPVLWAPPAILMLDDDHRPWMAHQYKMGSKSQGSTHARYIIEDYIEYLAITSRKGYNSVLKSIPKQ